MMETTIENMNDVRAVVATLTSEIHKMCNATTTEDVSNSFIISKDLLIALFKFNVERVGE